MMTPFRVLLVLLITAPSLIMAFVVPPRPIATVTTLPKTYTSAITATTTSSVLLYSTLIKEEEDEDVIQHLHRDYRLLQEALQYQAKYFDVLRTTGDDNNNNAEIIAAAGNCHDKKAYFMVMKHLENEFDAEQSLLLTRFAHNAEFEQNHPNAKPQNHRLRHRHPEDRLEEALYFFQLAKQAEMDLTNDMAELQRILLEKECNAEDDYDGVINEWFQAELRRHRRLVKVLTQHLRDQNPFHHKKKEQVAP